MYMYHTDMLDTATYAPASNVHACARSCARAHTHMHTHTHARTPTDGVHPNEHGYRVFSDFLGQEIAELLRAQVCLRPF